MEQSNCPLQTMILLGKYFKKANCRKAVKGLLYWWSKNKQIKRQARKSTRKHEYFTRPQNKGLRNIYREWYSPGSMAREKDL